MINKLLNVSVFLFISVRVILAQNTGLVENFNDNTLTNWTAQSYYNLSEANGELTVVATNAGGSGNFHVFSYSFPVQDLVDNPYVSIKIKANLGFRLRVDLEDANGRATNAIPTYSDISIGSSYTEYIFNFTGRFTQSFPTSAVVSTNIVKLVFFANPGFSSPYTGTFNFDDLKIGSATGYIPIDRGIRINQIGFYPNMPKTAIAVSVPASSFYIVSENKKDTLFTGVLGTANTWSLSGEQVRKADFSSFNIPGTYYLAIPKVGYSYPFKIKNEVHHAVTKASIKSYYYQRASSAIVQPWAGKWPRALGHADNQVVVHNSAATVKRPTGFKFNSSKGWYDAGDYNKYVINSGISTYTMLALYEHFADYYDTLQTFIPESSNKVPDLLDECMWQIRWLMTTQDPDDKGVYFKITDPDFTGIDMPNQDRQTRYAVQKSTTSALNFAAVMAQAARVVDKNRQYFPGLADTLINQALGAWVWARKNPNIAYDQSKLANPAINTGGYGDNSFSDEFAWAAHELYVTTKLDSFYNIVGAPQVISVPGWQNPRALGAFTLAHYYKDLTLVADTNTIKGRILALANSLRNHFNTNPYGVCMGANNGDFNWGSNGIAATQGMVLLQAFKLSNDSSYLRAAVANLDYLLGRNATDYCYVTGQGTKSPIDIHHRISAADGINEPIPGLLAGGPNRNDLSDCGAEAYPSTSTAKSYVDAWCSYSTNEVAINWNAPLSYLAGALEAILSGSKQTRFSFDPILPGTVGIEDELLEKNVSIYPNPFENTIIVNSKDNTLREIEIKDLNSNTILKYNSQIGENYIQTSLSPGIYLICLKSENAVRVEKIVKF